MEKSAVILGLSRQAKFLGLPMPYAMAVGAITVLPFILFKPVWWFLTAPIWYGLARLATKVNPNGHHVFVNGGDKSGHLAAQNQASGEALSAMARALAT